MYPRRLHFDRSQPGLQAPAGALAVAYDQAVTSIVSGLFVGSDVLLDLGLKGHFQEPARAVSQRQLQLRTANCRCESFLFVVVFFRRVVDGHFWVGFSTPRLPTQPAIHNFRLYLLKCSVKNR
jgi:hypothetical protein